MNINEIIKCLNELDFVRNPKNKAAAAELKKEAIATLEEYRNKTFSDPDDSKRATIINAILYSAVGKHPEIKPEIMNDRALTLYCKGIKKPDPSLELPPPKPRNHHTKR